jgi:hypothetical protein
MFLHCCFADLTQAACTQVTFDTSSSFSAPSGNFSITGYGFVPKFCHDNIHSTCSLFVCSDTLSIYAHSEVPWAVSVSVDGALLSPSDWTTAQGGTHSDSVGLLGLEFDTYLEYGQYLLLKLCLAKLIKLGATSPAELQV